MEDVIGFAVGAEIVGDVKKLSSGAVVDSVVASVALFACEGSFAVVGMN